MEFAMVNVPAAPVRRRPGHQREMVNQLLFGEAVHILKRKESGWLKIKSLHDDYEGWLTGSMVEDITEKAAKQKSNFVCSGLLNDIKLGEELLHIPFGANLPAFKNGKGKFGKASFNYEGLSVNRVSEKPNTEKLITWSKQWLNVPYLWGGRSPLGVDCSGFVQVIFKMTGIDIPRDTWQQAQKGEKIKKFKDAGAGDLVFFDRGEEIIHVGLMIDKDHVIHSSGKVRIDLIDKKGITDSKTGKRTVILRAIRRIIEH
jgi:cell wall-associated NlpC family hydrolase